jgi:hypothetical protein
VRHGVAAFARRLTTGETALVTALAAATFLVHDVSYALSQPYWIDEAWVAVTVRYPLSDLPAVTSSTPIGWSFLMRLFVVGGDQRQRLEPLLFCAGAVVVAYWLVRRLGWRDTRLAVGAGALSGFAVLTSPAMLVRNDLKQYTADACVGLVILTLASRLEREWSRRRLAGLAAAVPIGMLFSHAAAFVGVATWIAVVVVQFARRQWLRLRDATIVGAGTAVAMAVVYEIFDARAVVPGLVSFWRGYFVPVDQGVSASVDMIRKAFAVVRPYLGLGPTWLVIVLTVAGVVTLFCLGRPIVAVAILLLGPEMVALSAAKKYPLLDERTSTFLFVIVAVTAAVGVCGLCAIIARWSLAAAAAVAAVAVVASVSQTNSYFNVHNNPNEDVRSQAQYLTAYRASGDVVLVDVSSNWGFAYYWPQSDPGRRRNLTVLQNYVVDFPGDPRIVVADDRTPVAVKAALAAAMTKVQEQPGSRLWFVRTRERPPESAAWRGAMQSMGVVAKPVDRAGLALVTPNG